MYSKLETDELIYLLGSFYVDYRSMRDELELNKNPTLAQNKGLKYIRNQIEMLHCLISKRENKYETFS